MLVEQNRILNRCVAVCLKELSQIAPRPIRSVFTTVQYILWIKTCATRSILMTTNVPYKYYLITLFATWQPPETWSAKLQNRNHSIAIHVGCLSKQWNSLGNIGNNLKIQYILKIEGLREERFDLPRNFQGLGLPSQMINYTTALSQTPSLSLPLEVWG